MTLSKFHLVSDFTGKGGQGCRGNAGSCQEAITAREKTLWAASYCKQPSTDSWGASLALSTHCSCVLQGFLPNLSQTGPGVCRKWVQQRGLAALEPNVSVCDLPLWQGGKPLHPVSEGTARLCRFSHQYCLAWSPILKRMSYGMIKYLSASKINAQQLECETWHQRAFASRPRKSVQSKQEWNYMPCLSTLCKSVGPTSWSDRAAICHCKESSLQRASKSVKDV